MCLLARGVEFAEPASHDGNKSRTFVGNFVRVLEIYTPGFNHAVAAHFFFRREFAS